MTRVTRREAIGRVVGAGIGAASIFGRSRVGLATMQAQRPTPIAPGTRNGRPDIPTWKTELKQLAPNVFAYIQGGYPGMDNAGVSNAGVIVGPDHMMAIDSLAAPIHTKAFIAAGKKATGKPFGRLVNTHHHSDHTTGNCFFTPIEIVSHPYCREQVIKGGVPNLNRRPAWWKEGENELKLAPPTTTFEDKMVYYYGDALVDVTFEGPAHTYGDIMLYLPKEKILFAGDLAFYYVQPVCAGHVTKWIEAIDRINKLDVDVIVPGHGPLGTKKELNELRELLVLLKQEAKKRYDAGMSPGKAAADIDLGRFENWPNRERVLGTVVRLYAEFQGTIAADLPPDLSRGATEEYTKLKPPPLQVPPADDD